MKVTLIAVAIAISFAALLRTESSARAREQSPPWEKAAAASYLDQRQGWWMTWPTAARDHQTACVSCHTALPYALARPALRAVLSESGLSTTERSMLNSITTRVGRWREVEPFYDDQTRGLPKTSESRGTEAVLNALVLARYDAEAGTLSANTRAALANMWALQFKAGTIKGSWAWLNFRNAPWESDESQYWGTTLAAIAIGTAPGEYRSSPEIQEGLKLLRGYLSGNFAAQPLYNRTFALWSEAALTGVVSNEQRDALIRELLAAQQPDGGWSLTNLATWTPRRDKTPFETQSDGYATGLVTFVLQKAGVPRSEAHVSKGLAWLLANQNRTTGAWTAYSLNRQRDLTSDVGRFMSDAATAYAVLALSQP